MLQPSCVAVPDEDSELCLQIHAEQCLIANAVQHGERGLRKLAISEAPCGHCRQFYSELCCSVRASAPARPKLLYRVGSYSDCRHSKLCIDEHAELGGDTVLLLQKSTCATYT